MKNIIRYSAILIINVTVICVILYLISQLFVKFDELNPNVIASIIAALTAIYGYYYTQRSSKIREITESHRLQKIECYKNFMKIQADVLLSVKKNTNLKGEFVLPKDIQKRMVNFTTELINWGNTETIKAYKNFRECADKDGNNILIFLDQILFEIRKDLGHDNKGLRKGDLIKLFLVDPEVLDEKQENAI